MQVATTKTRTTTAMETTKMQAAIRTQLMETAMLTETTVMEMEMDEEDVEAMAAVTTGGPTPSSSLGSSYEA